jgi:1-deoxy-D-xylulose-5-phosphate reductoisomerase
LLNRGPEVIKRQWLYVVEYDAIELAMDAHRVVHSFVRFRDGSLKVDLDTTDTRLPIRYALANPDGRPSAATGERPSASGRLPGQLPNQRISLSSRRRPRRLPRPRHKPP